jgi:hypothetical protein
MGVKLDVDAADCQGCSSLGNMGGWGGYSTKTARHNFVGYFLIWEINIY